MKRKNPRLTWSDLLWLMLGALIILILLLGSGSRL